MRCSFAAFQDLVGGFFLSKNFYSKGAVGVKGFGRYKTSAWRKLRGRQLLAEPLCRYCLERGRVKSADVVDHIVPHKGNLQRFWDSENLQSLCYHCHNSIKQLEEANANKPVIGLDGWPVDD